jgi:2-polyprenyl-3-methyl-5-hydroxy-6-metoxy-1,4-benzoquinol methylase
MLKPTTDSVTYYNRRAADFAAQTADLDLSALHDKFLRHVRPGGRILDAGCGVGRDTLAFARRGYDVVAFDAAEEMVKLAQSRAGSHAAVHLMRFEEVEWRGEFDGIWACASLLHVQPASFPTVATRLADALRPGGAWYMSFKLGNGERLAAARLFVDHTEETLRAVLAGIPIQIVDVWESTDVRPGRGSENWLNAIAVRA